jgi:hypothetical protein
VFLCSYLFSPNITRSGKSGATHMRGVVGDFRPPFPTYMIIGGNGGNIGTEARIAGKTLEIGALPSSIRGEHKEEQGGNMSELTGNTNPHIFII